MSFQSRNNISGFTLIEVLIAMAILVMISFGIYQALTSTYRIREELEYEGDFYNGIRMSMEILGTDFGMIYSPTIQYGIAATPPTSTTATVPSQPLVPSQNTDPALQQLLGTDLGLITEFWAPVVDSTGARPSHFIGTENKLSFVSCSHIRLYKDASESEFARINYELRKDEGNTLVPDSQVLVKIENSNAFEVEDRKETAFIHTYPLLHGIQKFKYRYYRKDKETWYSAWDSATAEFKNLYPDLIEIALSVNGPTRLSFTGTYRFRPEVPLAGIDASF